MEKGKTNNLLNAWKELAQATYLDEEELLETVTEFYFSEDEVKGETTWERLGWVSENIDKDSFEDWLLVSGFYPLFNGRKLKKNWEGINLNLF